MKKAMNVTALVLMVALMGLVTGCGKGTDTSQPAVTIKGSAK